MVDIVDSATRSKMMAGIRSANTKPELRLRRALHALGFRFRLHDRLLPGRPDIVLPRWRAAIEVRGCYWHRHEHCKLATIPATRPEFWSAKFGATVERDKRNERLLRDNGWRLGVVWECALRPADISGIASDISAWLTGGVCQIELPHRVNFG